MKENIQMSIKYKERTLSTSLVIRKMQMKTKMSYHFTPNRQAKVKKTDNTQSQWRCEQLKTFMHCWWECKMVQPLWKTVYKYFLKLNICLLYDTKSKFYMDFRLHSRLVPLTLVLFWVSCTSVWFNLKSKSIGMWGI